MGMGVIIIRKTACFIIAVALVFSMLTFAHAENVDYNLGDVNLDKTVTVTDATIVQMHVAQTNLLSATQLLYADVNSDAVIDIIDATVIQLYIAMFIDSLPYNPDFFATVDEDNTITLGKGLKPDFYTLKYEDENGVLSDYADICTIEVKSTNKNAHYTALIDENKAPLSATEIGVYNSQGERITSIKLTENLTAPKSEKLYTFSALSDVHVGKNTDNKDYYRTSADDFIRALQYLNNDENVDFHCICGDLTVYASENELSYYKSIVDTYSMDTPVYVAAGNHEAYTASTAEMLESYTGNPLFYYFEKGDDVFIMLGITSSFEDRAFLDGELQWLYEVLEENRNKRCFIFEHLLTKEGCGNALNLHTGATLGNEPTSIVFKNLLSHYTNAIHFHGHSHMQFALQQYNDIANYDRIFGGHSVHIPSLCVPRNMNESGKLTTVFEASEGYVVDVYENGVYLRGRDFVNGKFLPIASYYLDTTLKTIEKNTFTDSTGIIDTTVTKK